MANAWDNLKQLLASETATVGEVKAFLSTLPEPVSYTHLRAHET